MSDPLNVVRSRYERITIPTLWVAVALSLILHAVALWGWVPNVVMRPSEDSKPGKTSGSLAVRLAPPPRPPPSAAPAPPPAPVVEAQPAPVRMAPSPKAAAQPRSAPPVLALERPSPSVATPPPTAAARPPADDLASYVEARRRARESAPASPSSQASPPSPPSESEQERHNRIVAANLGLNRTPSFGADRNRGGGIFQIARMGYDDAEFFFFGWNKDIRRNSHQMIAVRRGENPSMEVAVVRRMIAIIREHESGDFTWESQRLGRNVSLSARLADNAGLEDFIMRDFFPGLRLR